MLKAVKNYIELSKFSEKDFDVKSALTVNDLSKIESLTGVKLASGMKKLIIELSKIKSSSIANSDHSIVCDAFKSASVSPFGFSGRKNAILGVVNPSLRDPREYAEMMKELDESFGVIQSYKKKGLVSQVYPLFLFDSYDDSHVNICIDYLGRVVEYNYELDEEDCSILARTQSEFLNKLYVI